MAKSKEKATDVGKEKATSIDVVDADGNIVRTYSKKVHGKDFKDLAEGYVKIRAGEQYNEKLKLKNPGSEEEEGEESEEKEEEESEEKEESEEEGE